MSNTMIYVRGLVLPAVPVIFLAGVGSFFVAKLGQIAPFPATPALVVALAAATFSAYAAWFFWRLHRWESGAADPCHVCGGPLGRLQFGRRYFGRQLSDFRRCFSCGKANPVD